MKEGLKVLSLVDEMLGLDVEVRSFKCGGSTSEAQGPVGGGCFRSV